MWKVEILRRSGKFILVFYFLEKDEKENEDIPFIGIRGQVELENEEEKDKWLSLISSLNK